MGLVCRGAVCLRFFLPCALMWHVILSRSRVTLAARSQVIPSTMGTWPPSRLSTTYPVTAGWRTVPISMGRVMVPRILMWWPPAPVTCWAAHGVSCSWGWTVLLSKNTSVAPVSIRASRVLPIMVRGMMSWEVVVRALQRGSGGMVRAEAEVK